MILDVNSLFKGYLFQLELIVNKVPVTLFSQSLSDDMFSLEMNAKIAVNFLLRGYCPLIKVELVSFYENEAGKESVLIQIARSLDYLDKQPKIEGLDDTQVLTDKAGFNLVELPQSRFIHEYIIPNYLFHVSMVYATARAHGVPLSKGDFDGLHSYPANFSFVS